MTARKSIVFYGIAMAALPVGIVVTLLSAAILRKKEVLASEGLSSEFKL